MTALVRDQQHVTPELEERAHQQNQIPPVDGEEIEEHDELAPDEDLADDRRQDGIHVSAAGFWASNAKARESSVTARDSLIRLPPAEGPEPVAPYPRRSGRRP